MKRITFTIGIGMDKHGSHIHRAEELLNLASRRVAETFGGYTLTRGSGGWIAPNGELVEESSVVFSVVTEEHREVYASSVAVFLRDLFSQECVLVTVEDLQGAKFV